jgi:hypothetical protein
MLLRDCKAPPDATLSYVLVTKADRGFEWDYVPLTQNSSPCRDFHRFLYGSNRGYETVKSNVNQQGMFVVYDKKTNHVRIVVKDPTLKDVSIPGNYQRVRVPPMFQKLNPNYIPAIAGGLLGTATVGGIAYAAHRYRKPRADTPIEIKPSSSLGRSPKKSPDGSSQSSVTLSDDRLKPRSEVNYPEIVSESSSEDEIEVVNTRRPGIMRLGYEEDSEDDEHSAGNSTVEDDYVQPVNYQAEGIYRSSWFPGTYQVANLQEINGITQARNKDALKLRTTGEIITVFDDTQIEMRVGSLQTVVPLVWGDQETRYYVQAVVKPQPWVYYYNTMGNKPVWRYYRVEPDNTFLRWSEGVCIDLDFIMTPNADYFTAAYQRCASTIIDFQGVKEIHNIFQIIKEKEWTDVNDFRAQKDRVVSMMTDSHVMMTPSLQKVLEATLETVKISKHPLAVIYNQLDWQSLARRLLTKRALYYYGQDDVWGYYDENKQLISGKGSGAYIVSVVDKFDQYLHPDEAVISSLLGLKVPSFAYDDGKHTNACQKRGLDFFEVVMLPQVGARLENHSRLDCGDLFLVQILPQLKTPFQQALKNALGGVGTDLYEARSRLVIQQAFNAAIYHDVDTHLILTGLGQGHWRGQENYRTILKFSNALISVIRDIQDFGKLKYLTVMGYDVTPTTIEQMRAACQAKQLQFNYEYKPNTTPVFRRHLGLVDMFSFAWDGMSLVGNEYYNKLCGQSADPAAAYSTSVAFLSHPRINPDMYAVVI